MKENMKEKILLVVKSIAVLVIIALICILFTYKCERDAVVEVYTITFNSEGGTNIVAQEVEENKKVSKPADPVKEGYTFVGWYVGDTPYNFDTEVTSDLTIVAKWEEIVIINVTGVTTDQTSITLSPGGKTQIVAIIEPENANDTSVTWSSSNEEIVTVDENGNVQAVKEGKAVITVVTNDGGFTANVNVKVSSDVVAVTGVTLNTTTLNLATKSSATLKATVAPSKASNKGLTWKSSNTNVATVDANGRVTGKSEGTATITVTTKDGGYTATCKVTVKDVNVTGLSISTNAISMYVGESKTVKATVKPDNATNKSVTWKSADTSIATVSSSGQITGKKAGSTTVTVTTTDGSFSKTITVAVKEKVAVSEITISGNSSGTEGGTIQLTATVKPTDAFDKTVTWKSSDTGIATVSSSGKVTLKKTGTVTITATAKSGVSATHTIKVNEKAASYSIKFSPIVQEGTGAITQYSFTVTKNNAAFSDYSFIMFNGTKVNKGSYLSAAKYSTGVTTAQVRLSNGDTVTATVRH